MGAIKLSYYNEEANFLSVFSKKEVPENFFSAPKSALDYYPFGMSYIEPVEMLLPERHESTNEYRYGFNGQEKDDEIAGEGNSYTAQYWQYDSRLGRRWNIEPITYAWQSTYSTNNNNPIRFTDPTGLYGEGRAKRKQEKAVKRYGPNRVTGVHYNENTKEWGFGVVNKRDGNISNKGLTVDSTTGIYSNKQFRQFDNNQPGRYIRKRLMLFGQMKMKKHKVEKKTNYGIITIGINANLTVLFGGYLEGGLGIDLNTGVNKFYYEYGKSIGVDASIGPAVHYVKPSDPNVIIKLPHLNGEAEELGVGIGPADGTLGGNSIYKGNGWNPESRSNGYYPLYKTYGIGYSWGSPFGLTGTKGTTKVSNTGIRDLDFRDSY